MNSDRRRRRPAQAALPPSTNANHMRQPAPIERQPLREMMPSELDAWLLAQRAELEDFCTYAQEYMKRRARRLEYRTATDERYERFFVWAVDLLAGLSELRELIEPGDQEEQ